MTKRLSSYLALAVAVSLILSAVSCRPIKKPVGDGDGKVVAFPKEDITLEYYRLFDDDNVLDEIIKAYQEEHPNITISVRKIAMPEGKTIYNYQQNDIIKPIADGEGPDMFMIHNDWLPYQINQISPMPSSVMTVDSYTQKFPTVVVNDFVTNNRIYAVPYYIDNLMLFYNTDLFTAAKISRDKIPPKTWSDVAELVPKLTKYNADRSIAQSAISLGVADEWIPRFAEILATLIMQQGGQMTSADRTKATFDLPTSLEKLYFPGENALKFYTDFANPANPLYTYSDAKSPNGSKKFPGDIQAFMEGKSAMFIGYSYQVTNIKKYVGRSFSFDTAPLPQWLLENPVVVANYWGETVSKNSKYPAVAWDFIKFASQRQNLRSYLNNTGKVPATKELAENYADKTYLGPIVKQIKYSKAWYRSNTEEVERIMARMVNGVLHQGISAKIAIDTAVKEINELGQKPWTTT